MSAMTHPMFGDDVSTEIDQRQPQAEEHAFRIVIARGGSGAFIVDRTTPSAVLVGKSAACQLVIPDPRISRRHASFELADAGLRVLDLGSTNGTFVNGLRVTDATLTGGEVIGVGDAFLQIERIVSQAAETAPSAATSFGRILGTSPAMRRLYPLCERLAAADIPVVIEGETGTGKELLAEALHETGHRRAGPFIVVDCSTVVPSRIEAMLFGEQKTGTRGVFEQASGGTILLDEITELPIEVQSKLLRAIDRGELSPVGSDRWVKVDVRVIATTRRDIEKEVEQGRFREDLFFRLAVGRVALPPLRQRHGDVRLLAEHFAKQVGGPDAVLPADFVRRYEGYGWPGNVRELANIVSRRIALGSADPDHDDGKKPEREGAPENAFRWLLDQDLPFASARDLVSSEFERAYVERVLAQHNGNVSRAAAASGLARRYFQILKARHGR